MSSQIHQLRTLLLQHVTETLPLDISNIRFLFKTVYGCELITTGKMIDFLHTHFSKQFIIKEKNSAFLIFLKPQPAPVQNSTFQSTAQTENTPFGSIEDNNILESILEEELNSTDATHLSKIAVEYKNRTGKKLNYSGKLLDALLSVPRLSELFEYEFDGFDIFLYSTLEEEEQEEEEIEEEVVQKKLNSFPSKTIEDRVEQILMQHLSTDGFQISRIGDWYKQSYNETLQYSGTLLNALLSTPNLNKLFTVERTHSTVYLYPKRITPNIVKNEKPNNTLQLPQVNVSTPCLYQPNTLIDDHNVFVIDSKEETKDALEWISCFDTIACDMQCTEYDQTISLIQIATTVNVTSKETLFPKKYPIVFLFDMLCKEKQFILSMLKQFVFENASIMKLFHDARYDCKLLWKQASIRVQNILDTQVQVNYLTNLQKILSLNQTKLELPNENDRIGLNTLLQQYLLSTNTLKKEFLTIVSEQVEYWKQRPLSNKAIQYVSMDVTQLIALCNKLNTQIAVTNAAIVSNLSNRSVLSDCPEMSEQEHAMLIDFDSSNQLITSKTPKSVNIVFEEQLAELIQTIHDLEGSTSLLQHEKKNQLSEIVLDVGRTPLTRFIDDSEIVLNNQFITAQQLQTIQNRISQFGPDHRSGLTNTLHRFCRLVNKKNEIVGLTIRVGKTLHGIATIFQDILSNKKNSILIVSEPGSGKTTLLRDMAKFVADEIKRRVVIVDTSNEIGGDGDCPHESIGSARRIQVLKRNLLHETMIEAVQNHNPQTVVIDEIGNSKEVIAAKSIQTRGVQMIATAHGTVMDLLHNPELNGLLGGLQTVILGDVEMKARNVDTKTLVERRGNPCFNVIVEILGWRKWRVFLDTAVVVDNLLKRNRLISNQIRFFTEKQEMMLLQKQIFENFDDEKMQVILSKAILQGGQSNSEE